MTKSCVTLLAVFMSCFRPSDASLVNGEPSAQCLRPIIAVTDKDSPSKNAVIEKLLALQRSLVIPVRQPIPEENVKNGFLLIPMTPAYVGYLLDQKDGLIVGAYQGETLVGYVLLIEIDEFKDLYQDNRLGYVEMPLCLEPLESLLSQTTVGYIEQIAVKPGHAKRGIGTQLIEASKNLKPDGLVADVFLDPLTNEASLRFFSRLDFKMAGTLYQHPRSNFPYPHRTQVFLWNPSPL